MIDENSEFMPPQDPASMDDAAIQIRTAAWQYSLTPAQVWGFFRAGMVAAQVLKVFEAVDRRERGGNANALD